MTSIIFIVVSLIDTYFSKKKNPILFGEKKRLKWKEISRPLSIFSILFFLGIDFWAWGSSKPLLVGFPWWIWYFIILNILLMIAMVRWLIPSDAPPLSDNLKEMERGAKNRNS